MVGDPLQVAKALERCDHLFAQGNKKSVTCYLHRVIIKRIFWINVSQPVMLQLVVCKEMLMVLTKSFKAKIWQ